MEITALLLLAVAGSAFTQDLYNTLNPMVELKANLELLSRDTTNLDDPKYRLADTVQPHFIYVDLDVYLDQARFTGVVTHEVTIQASTLTQIVLHQNVVAINSVSILDSNNQRVALNTTNPFETDSYFEILLINLVEAIPAGNYTITISYEGKINENPVDRGFYMGYYYLNNQKRYYATTQFQPYHARKAFPCFDEPQFKSRFTISITRDANLSPSYSNMAINQTENLGNNRIRETFLPTPIVSAYLVAFHVSDFVETTSTSTVSKPFGIISRPGVINQHSYAAEIGLDITNELDDYLAINYYEMGQDQPMKNDHIALPDFPSGAMENWGMVNYREAYLLYDPDNTNIQSKTTIATIMAHELGHKWFGNLVTCFWWSNLWLNESFASFFEYFAAHWADRSLELDTQFVVDYVHSALNADASVGAAPMNWSSVVDNPSISAHFSTSSYAKGASVLRMMEHFVGARTFRNALRYYLRNNEYGLGTPVDMYTAFRTAVSEDRTFASRYPGIDVGAVLDSWVQNAGSPVLNVTNNVDTGEITIRQQRFLLNGGTTTALWQVPITWTHSGNADFQNVTPAFVMTQRSTTVQKEAGHQFVVLNTQTSGLYRVNYDDHNWEMIASALKRSVNSVNNLNRGQMMNDIVYFLRAGGYITVNRAFDIIDYLRYEDNYYAWSGALSNLDWLRRRIIHLDRVHENYKNYLLELMDYALNELGYAERSTDSTSTILNRMQLMNYACVTLQHEGCRNYSLTRWQQYRQNENNLVNVNERRYVYCVGINEGNTTDYNFLFQKYNTSENTADMVVILRTLACTNNTANIVNYLEQTLYNDRIRIHDKTNAFSYALQGPPENLPTILNFLYTRWSEIRTWYGGDARLNIAVNAVAAYLTDFKHITEFQSWLYSNQLALPASTFSSGVAVINSAIANLEWGNRNGLEIFNEVTTRNRNSAATITTPIVLLLVAFIAHLLK